jgi:glycosyltransferase involved in cell wall biosynthesis
MKILQINKYHYIRGGSDSVYFNSGKLLVEKGNEVVYFAMHFDENVTCTEEKYFAENKDFTTLSLKKKITNLPSFFYNKNAEKNLLDLIESEKPDIAHLHIFYGSLTSSILKILKENNIPVVVSVHDYKFICPSYILIDGQNKVCEDCKGKNYFNAIKKKCIKNSFVFSSIFALEAYYRDFFYPLDQMFSKLIFVSKFSANIHNKYKPELQSITTHLYNFDPSLELKKQNSKKGNYFLYAGRISREKGIKTLLKAFGSLPNIYLKIAGTGEGMEEYKNLATPNITFLGFQKGEELREVIANASFVMVPSEWYENNPMAIIEAYSIGKPVIASNIGGIPEIVKDNTTGFLFQSGNAEDLSKKICQANEISEADYAAMSDNAVLYASKEFSPEVHYKQLMKIYQEALVS